jgi:hypothetical protein
MTELVTYGARPVATAAEQKFAQLDSWMTAMADVVKLSEYIAETDFVPEAMRRKPAAVAAAILTGREMGIAPMAALRHIHVVKGKPGQSAELMRAMAQDAGHEIRYIDMTDTRVVVEGRRREQSEWTRVAFTADQARRAKIDLGGYPEDKLVARATSRLCRRLFADAIAGLSTIDELEDGIETAGQAPVVAQAERADGPVANEPAATARRRTAPRKQAQPTKAIETPAEQPSQEAETAGPPLPGEDGYDEPTSEDQQQDAAAGDTAVTEAQLKKIMAIFNEVDLEPVCQDAGLSPREGRMTVSSHIVNRELTSANDLTKTEASVLIDTLEELGRSGDLLEALTGLLTPTTKEN